MIPMPQQVADAKPGVRARRDRPAQTPEELQEKVARQKIGRVQRDESAPKPQPSDPPRIPGIGIVQRGAAALNFLGTADAPQRAQARGQMQRLVSGLSMLAHTLRANVPALASDLAALNQIDGASDIAAAEGLDLDKTSAFIGRLQAVVAEMEAGGS